MGVVNTTYTFSGTDTITSSKLNNIIDDTTFTSDAIQGTTLQVVSPGKLAVSAGGITSNELASQSVTPAKLSNSDFGDFTVSGGVATIDNGVVTPVKLSQPLTSATAQNSTSGTSIDFTGIPSWVKRITVMFNGVSTSGSSIVQIRLGTSGGIVATGYSGRGDRFLSTSTAINVFTASNNSTGFNLENSLVSGAASSRSGLATITLINGNTWVLQSYYGVAAGESAAGTGVLDLGGTLDRLRITTVNGTDTFDAGSVNIMYE
jgi:hypothetical protein